MSTSSKAKVTVKKETTFEISDYLTTGHLVQIIDQCRSYDPDTRVSIQMHYGQRDSYEGMTITVHGA